MNSLLPAEITQTLKDFWSVVVDVWTDGIWGINIGQILVAVLVLSIFVVVRNLITRYVIRKVRASTLLEKLHDPENVADALEPPLRFVPIVLGAFFALEFLALEGLQAEIGYRIIRSLVAVVIFWSLHNLVAPLSFLLERLERIFTPEIVQWLAKAIQISFIFIGSATILEIWGIQVGPVLAGLGLIGIAVALGAQDLFKNLIGGLLILAEKRFSVGDWVYVEGVVEGTVEDIGFRSTLVRQFDKAPVYVPNTEFAENPVTNFSQMTHRRIYWKIGVLYSTTLEQLRQIRDGIEAYILENQKEFASPSEVATFVRVDSFNDSSIDIMVYCFTRTTKWGEWLEVKERLAYRIKDIVEDTGSGFAFPSRSLYIETPNGDVAEPFVPPSTNG